MHEIKRRIIHHLRYHPGAKFSELKIESVDSNKLSYHLKALEKKGIIEHKESRYILTGEGKKLLNFLSNETAETRKQPVCVVAMIPVDKDKVLLQERLKEPWYGYWLLVAGKIEMGESLKEAIDRELFEETMLEGEARFAGLVSSRSYDKDKLTYHIHMYCFKLANLKGKLKKDIKEGKNRWFKQKDVSKLKMHPLDYMIYKKRDETDWLIEQEEYFDGEKLLRTETRNIR
jgi:ADP-ribose pyrophosphatase YjhB (NUDIX family)